MSDFTEKSVSEITNQALAQAKAALASMQHQLARLDETGLNSGGDNVHNRALAVKELAEAATELFELAAKTNLAAHNI